MLNRKQLLIHDWLDEYIKELCRVQNTNYCEVVRMMLSYGFAQVISKNNPDNAFPVDLERLAQFEKDVVANKQNHEVNGKLKADIYYEARRVIENRTEDLKKIDKGAEKLQVA